MGGLAPTVDELAFRQYFEQFGAVDDAVVMYDHDSKRPRGFGFITFVMEDTVDQVRPTAVTSSYEVLRPCNIARVLLSAARWCASGWWGLHELERVGRSK